MKYPFNTSEDLIFDFESLLKDLGLNIQSNSDLERISLAVLETNAKHRKEIPHDDKIDIRTHFSDVAGLVDFIRKIVKHKAHKDFNQLVPHIKILNKASTPVLTSKSKITDEGNNKLMELYIALLCMDFATNIRLDDPDSSKGDNPDVMFTYLEKEWAIACKAMHSAKEKTLYDTIEKGTEQINRSSAEKGIVIVNFKNIIDREQIWPIINKAEFEKGEEPHFACFSSIDAPIKLLQAYGCDYQKKLVDTIGTGNLLRLSSSKKCPSGFLIFLHAMTAVQHGANCPATILKTFNLVQFDTIGEEYKSLAKNLNDAMHT